MPIRETIDNAHSGWMDAEGQGSNIVISSRVRIARNLAGIPFPHLLDQTRAEEVVQAVRLAIVNNEAKNLLGPLELSILGELSPVERQILVDKHLISPEFINNYQSKAIVLRDDEVVSIMVNEEDHLRIQCLLPGLQLKEAWEIIDNIDDGLEKTLDYAFSEKLGYLTTCPTNVGTGMRASIMLHLPGLILTKQLGVVLSAISKLGLTVRGLYGEGTEAQGNLFQVSNQITLGQSEEEICNNLLVSTRHILSQEQAARSLLYQQRREAVEDRVYRAYGTLRCARLLTSEEAMRLISDLRLGVDLNIIAGIKPSQLNELMIKIRPAFLYKLNGKELPASQRYAFRAALVRKEFEDLPQ
ncbi:MAG: protein arginine kinase [Desulfotomaculaceae bacterium]|nr:protein arginine kinase [Desulfotomaculaceae bacterium]